MRTYVITIVALTAFTLLFAPGLGVHAAEDADTSRGDQMLAAYFKRETRKLAEACLADVKSWDDWTTRREELRRQLCEMLGLDPLPERTPLEPVVTGKIDRDDFTVENLHFQSRPHLYVTANLYLPKNLKGKAPAILYVCGHSKAVKNGISYGNKTQYQHHGAWFARNGYVCLVIDTLQLGEIEGIHHGTYRENMWWWNARGYTPAGVETWNSIRALDYLSSRPEVDADRIGVTGRSGGGAYSWYLAALDDRVKVSIPVAGITTLKNHVVDGCVEGHCDCMFFVNTYRWDYPQLAALSAPIPLQLANSDLDHIFPLDGVMDVHNKLRAIYELDDKRDELALHITHGPHKDTQVLQMYAFEWFNHYLKNDDAPITMLAEKFFEPEELKVFATLPADQINTRAHETFVPMARQSVAPTTSTEWKLQRAKWTKALREKCFAGWPAEVLGKDQQSTALRPVFRAKDDGMQFQAYEFDSQPDVRLLLYLLLPADVPLTKLKSIELRTLDAAGWTNFATTQNDFAAELKGEPLPAPTAEQLAEFRSILSAGCGVAYFAPRGIGPTAWNADPVKQTHIRRRFMLLGQTLDGMRVWDVRRAIQTLRSIDGLANVPLRISARGDMAGIALYAALFEPNIEQLDLWDLPKSHRDGPDFLNVLRILDVPQTVAMVAENARIVLRQDDVDGWDYPLTVANKLDFSERIEIESTPVGGK